MSETTPPARSNRVRNLLLVAVLAAVVVFVVLARSAGTGVVNSERRGDVMQICFDVSYTYVQSIGKETEPGYGIDMDACYAWADIVLLGSPAVVDKCLIAGVVQEKQEQEAACFVAEGVEVPVHIIEP